MITISMPSTIHLSITIIITRAITMTIMSTVTITVTINMTITITISYYRGSSDRVRTIETRSWERDGNTDKKLFRGSKGLQDGPKTAQDAAGSRIVAKRSHVPQSEEAKEGEKDVLRPRQRTRRRRGMFSDRVRGEGGGEGCSPTASEQEEGKMTMTAGSGVDGDGGGMFQ